MGNQSAPLRACRGEQEIALVALGIDGAVELGAAGPVAPLDVMAGREHVRAELARRLQEIAELDLLVAGDARHGRLAGRVAVGELAHDGGGEACLVIEHVVGDAERCGNAPRIVDVLPRAAAALAARRAPWS